jgi:voltage-gated sodium channel
MNRDTLTRWIESDRFQYTIITIIILNAITLGLETSPRAMSAIGPLLLTLDTLFLSIFTVEIAIKLYAYRLRFFKNGWNNFDFTIVAVSLLPFLEAFSVLRALRILRVLRLISVVPAFRRVVMGFLDALSGLAAVGSMLLLVLYVFAVMATKLFGSSFPEWFGSIGASLYSLFQIMTLESWSMGIVRPVMEVYPLAWLFFVPFILITTFAVLNLLIGIIVSSMQNIHEAEKKLLEEEFRAQHKQTEEIEETLASIERSVRDIREKMREQ